MSMYGPPGGGQYPGAPQDPWQGGAGDPYGGNPYGGQPAGQPGGDPYGQPSGAPYGQQPYDQPGNPPYGPAPYGQPSGVPYPPPYGQQQPGGVPYGPYGQQPGGSADPWAMGQQPMPPMSGPPWGPPPAPQKSNAGLVVGLSAVVVLVLLLGAVLMFLVVDRDDGTPVADSSASPSLSSAPSESPSSEAPSDKPTKYDIDDAAAGDCLYDSNPSATKASLSFVDCDQRGEDHYKVLKRFDNTTDTSRCENVSGYESSFTSDDGQFVLCVKELT